MQVLAQGQGDILHQTQCTKQCPVLKKDAHVAAYPAKINLAQ